MIYFCLCLILGLLGQTLLTAAWRRSQVQEFERSVQAVASLAGSQGWSIPWESDTRWQQLESELGIDLVPLRDFETTAVHWVLSPSGTWRATVTRPLSAGTGQPKDQSVGSVRAIRGTRDFRDHGVGAFWWLVWSGLSLVLSFALWLAQRSQRQPYRAEYEIVTSGREPDTVAATLEQAERLAARLQLVVSHLNEGVMAVDQQGRILVINPVLRQQLELSEQESVTTRTLVEVVRVPRIVEMLEHVLRSKQAIEQTIEVGSAGRYLRLLAAPLPIDQVNTGGLLTATDVSSTQRSELARREFVTGASHELKTPLAAIRAYTETLQSIGDDDPATSSRFLQNILDQADRMDRLVTGMLQLARAESGALKLKLERIDAVITLRPCLEAATGLAKAKGIEFQAKLPEERLLVQADRDALQTIVSNLLSNAVRYTPAGGRIEIELLTDTTTNSVCLRVSDTGIGIAPSDHERIFERFYRVQKDRALDSGGTGLGLAIVKQLTQVLDGTVQVSSRPGEGTRFEIRLPAVGFTQSSSNASG